MKKWKTTGLLCDLPSTGMGTQAGASGPRKVLVAYYSHTGNTRAVAEYIREATGGDLFEIVPVKPYSSDYRTVVEQARKEIGAGFCPELKTQVEDMGRYDLVFVGSPCWWGTVVPPVSAFLSSHDLAGKTVVPFMTHEGSRMGHSEADIRKLCPRSTGTRGFPVRGGAAASSGPVVRRWLEGLETEQVLK